MKMPSGWDQMPRMPAPQRLLGVTAKTTHRLESALSIRFGKVSLDLWLLACAVVIYTLVYSELLFARYQALELTIDFGSQSQNLHSILVGSLPWWYELGTYFSLFDYTSLPLLYLARTPIVLLVYQTLLIAIAAIPLYLLARTLGFGRWQGLVVAGAYLSSPMTGALNWFDIHIELTAMAFIFSFFYCYYRGNIRYATVWLVLALTFSQLVTLGLVAWLSTQLIQTQLGRQPGPSRWLAAASMGSAAWLGLTYLVGIFFIPDGQSVVSQAASHWPGVGSNPAAAFLGPFTSPGAFAMNVAFESDLKIWYLLFIFGTLLFIPLLSTRSISGVLPWLFLVLSSTDSPTYSVLYYQYGALLLPYLFLGFVLGSHRIRTLLRGSSFQLLVWCILVPLVLGPLSGPATDIALTPLLLTPVCIAALEIANSKASSHGLYVDPQRSITKRSLRTILRRPARSPRAAPYFLKRTILKDNTDSYLKSTPLERGGIVPVLFSSINSTIHQPRWTTSPRVTSSANSKVRSRMSRLPRGHHPSANFQIPVTLGLATVVIFTLYTPIGPLSGQTTAYHWPTPSPRLDTLQQILSLIPPNATVLTQNHLLPRLWSYPGAELHTVGSVPPQYIFADVGSRSGENDYFTSPVPPYPPMSTVIYEALLTGRYGVLAEASGLILLERGYIGGPLIFHPSKGVIPPCHLDRLPNAPIQCYDGRLIQFRPGFSNALWYGPYQTVVCPLTSAA